MKPHICLNLKRVNVIFLTILLAVISLSFSSCENNINAEYETIKSRNVILVSNEGKEYRLKIIKDPAGTDKLEIEPVTK